MKIKGLFFIACLWQSIVPLVAQAFRDPLNIPIQLAANFGELRTNHYHMGLDIRTQQRENLPVYAAADGYVSRVYISPAGYGNMIMVTHPDGYTTLYAHLNKVMDTLAQYIRAKQYKDREWKQDFTLPPGLFPVSKGQQIALSGNTGGSEGPHLHFEIRDTKSGRIQNPLLIQNFVPDNIRPILYRMFWYDRRLSTYQAAAKPIVIKGSNGEYSSVSPVVRVGSPIISLGFHGEDKTGSSSFRFFGIYKAVVKEDGNEIFSFLLNDFTNDESRYVNAGIDYKRNATGGGYVQHLSRLPGNRLNIFSGGNGVIILNDSLPHELEVSFFDPAGNKSVFKTKIQLSTHLDEIEPTDHSAVVQANQSGSIQSAHAVFSYSDAAFYDYAPFALKETASTAPLQASRTVEVGKYYIPVHDFYTIGVDYDTEKGLADKVFAIMELNSNGSRYFAKGTWQGDKLLAKFNRLGTVRIVLDSIPPAITPVGWHDGIVLEPGKNIMVRVRDDLSGVDAFNGWVDGKWILFSQRGSTFTYVPDENFSEGEHEIRLTAVDLAGNVTEKRVKIIRK